MEIRKNLLAKLALIFGGVALIAATVIYFLRPELDIFFLVSLGSAILCLFVYIILDRSRLRLILKGRKARYGSNALIFGAAFLGVMIVFRQDIS